MTITVTIPDTPYAVLQNICGKDGKVLNLEQNGEVELECEGQKYKTKMEDVIPLHEIEHIRGIFRKGKIAWITRRLRKII
jgi:hypothetical protein